MDATTPLRILVAVVVGIVFASIAVGLLTGGSATGIISGSVSFVRALIVPGALVAVLVGAGIALSNS